MKTIKLVLFLLIVGCKVANEVEIGDENSLDDLNKKPTTQDAYKEKKVSYITELAYDVNKLEAEFDSRYSLSNLPDLHSSASFLGDDFAFKTTNWLLFYIRMHQITDKDKWLNYLESTINHLFSHTDKERHLRSELDVLVYDQAPDGVFQESPFVPHLGWSNQYSNQNRRVEILTDGNICKHIMMSVNYIKTNNLAINTDSYIQNCEDILNSHNTSYVEDRYNGQANRITIDGAYFYPSRTTPGALYSSPVAFNHNTVTAQAYIYLYKYTNKPEYLNKAKKIRDFFMRHYIEQANHLMWSYSINKEGVKRENEDVNHSSYNVSFIYTMWKEGHIEDDVIYKINNLIPNFLTETTCAHSIDGTGVDDGGDWVSVSRGYLDVAYDIGSDSSQKLILKSLSYKYRELKSNLWHAEYRTIADILYFDKKRLE